MQSSAGFSYLRSDVKLEPVIFRWPVWPQLLAPATYAMNVAFRQLQNLKSFLSNPAIHINAAKNPAMLGGPFVCLSQADIPAVRELMKDITEQCREFVTFARDYHELNEKLRSAAKGFCLDEFAANLPASLAGLVDLVYDLNNHPKIKVIEELLYEFLPPLPGSRQICLHRTAQVDRQFFMSTPRLDASDHLFLTMDFNDPRIDELSALRMQAGSMSAIAERLGIESGKMDLFASFFVPDAPLRQQPEYAGDDVRVRYFGHACVLIQAAGVSILLDPLVAWERAPQEASLTYAELPDHIDYVVISHPHHDHLVSEVLLQLRARVGTVIVPRNDRGNLADPSARLILQQLGFRSVRSLEPFESIAINQGEILALPFLGEHAGLDIMSKNSILVRVKGRTVLFLVDSDVVESALYRRLSRTIGKLDALFIGMECHGAPLTWLYGPLLTAPVSRRDDDSRRLSGLNCERARKLLHELDCSRVFVYAMGQEPWLKHLMGLAYTPGSVQLSESDKFIEHCRGKGIPAERLFGCREIMF